MFCLCVYGQESQSLSHWGASKRHPQKCLLSLAIPGYDFFPYLAYGRHGRRRRRHLRRSCRLGIAEVRESAKRKIETRLRPWTATLISKNRCVRQVWRETRGNFIPKRCLPDADYAGQRPYSAALRPNPSIPVRLCVLFFFAILRHSRTPTLARART